MNLRLPVLLCACTLALTACGGTKLVKHAAAPPMRETPLAVASDGTLGVQLDQVIVRNAPGAWAKNADWDEYLISVRNVSSAPVRINSISVTDSSGYSADALNSRKPLVKASKQTAKRYRKSGIKVMAGYGSPSLVAAGVGAGVIGYGAALGSAAGSMMGGAAAGGGAASAVAGGLILGAPVLVGFGIVRAVNNGKVNNRLESRATHLPNPMDAGADAQLDMFFPLSPSPQRVTIRYSDAQGDHQLDIDTRQALAGLHLAAPAESTATAPATAAAAQ
jgi:hypothetical protein